MSGVNLPLTRLNGRALIVGSPACRADLLGILQQQGLLCAQADDPCAAMLELSSQPRIYRLLVLSLSGIYPEELEIITSIKTRFPQIEIWLAHIENRQTLLDQAIRLGANGLLQKDGFHQTNPFPPSREPKACPFGNPSSRPSEAIEPETSDEDALNGHEMMIAEPILTADELRALLQEEGSIPPGARND